VHDHHHSASHDHNHAHGHSHVHGHSGAAAPVLARPAVPGFSLLRLSAGQRLAGAGLIVLALWGAVFWALQ
jgi:ABC-type nickel/cobalt efflux system permease component RcnA